MSLARRLLAIIASERPSPRPRAIPPRKVDPGALPQGFIDPRQRDGTRRIALTLDQPTFDRVRDYAALHKVSFAAAARALIAQGCVSQTKDAAHG